MSASPGITVPDTDRTSHDDTATASQPSAERLRRPGRLSLAGGVLGLVFGAMS